MGVLDSSIEVADRVAPGDALGSDQSPRGRARNSCWVDAMPGEATRDHVAHLEPRCSFHHPHTGERPMAARRRTNIGYCPARLASFWNVSRPPTMRSDAAAWSGQRAIVCRRTTAREARPDARSGRTARHTGGRARLREQATSPTNQARRIARLVGVAARATGHSVPVRRHTLSLDRFWLRVERSQWSSRSRVVPARRPLHGAI